MKRSYLLTYLLTCLLIPYLLAYLLTYLHSINKQSVLSYDLTWDQTGSSQTIINQSDESAIQQTFNNNNSIISIVICYRIASKNGSMLSFSARI